MLWLSPLVAAVAVLVGVWLSYALNASSGGMIGVALGIEFALAYVFGPHGALRRG